MVARLTIRRLVRDAAIVAAVTLGLVVVLEIFLRLFLPQSLSGTSVRGEHFSGEDSLLGYRYMPGAVWRFRHPEYRAEYAINAQGFRDASPHPVPKPPHIRRVLLLGDSFTFGQGVEYEHTWPVIVEQMLRRRSIADLELVKAGVQGMDTRSELILLRRLAHPMEADAVVVGFLINDVYTNVPYDPPAGAAADSVHDWTDVRHTVFVRQSKLDRTFHLLALARRLITSIDAAYVELYLAAPGRGEFLRSPLPDLPRRQLAVTERLLEQMADYTEAAGMRLIVLSIPQQFQVLYLGRPPSDTTIDVHLYDRHFSAVAARRGFDWIATLDAFSRADTTGTELFYRLDGHLTPAGNAVLAGIVMEKVVPLLRSTQPVGDLDHTKPRLAH